MSEKIIQTIGRIRERVQFLGTLRPNCRERLKEDLLYRGALLHYLYLVADGVVAEDGIGLFKLTRWLGSARFG